MSGEVTYESMYQLGYADALEDIRDLICEKLKEIDKSDDSRHSYFSGIQVALHSISEATYKLKADDDSTPMVNSVEVVRCKDCKFYENAYYDDDYTKQVCRLFKRQMQYDDFCSYGERK